MNKTVKRIIFIIYDILSVLLSSFLGLLLSHCNLNDAYPYILFFNIFGICLEILLYVLFNLYNFSQKYASVYELTAIVFSGIVYGISTLLFVVFTKSKYVNYSYAFISAMILVIFEGISRFAYRLYRSLKNGSVNLFNVENNNNKNKENCLIVGAGEAGAMIAKDLMSTDKTNLIPIGFVDDDPAKLDSMIYGVKVRGNRDDIKSICKYYDCKKILVCLPTISKDERLKILSICNETNAKVLTLPGVYELVDEKVTLRSLKHVSIEDLLGRDQIDVIDNNTINFYKDKVVLVTGGGGSIGSELCRQLSKMNPKEIIVLDIYENCAYDLQQELKMKYKNDLNLKVEIISITNKPALERVFIKYKPNIVIMAAAHKHVPLMENNIIEAVENNVFGTFNTVELSIKYNVDRVHMVSTDKAVNPTSVMGATKRICEMICESYSKEDIHTTFSITRFGNVLGSAGSVIPLFKRQIKEGGPITITDYRIIRYFMTIPEASSLVLESASMAKNGELFVLDMGKPVKIYDLALNMIRLSGLEVDKDIKIIETGLRPGEKLYEELLVKTEELDKTSNKLIFIERDKPIDVKILNDILSKLESGINAGSDSNMRNIIKEVVPTFKEMVDANKDFNGNEPK